MSAVRRPIVLRSAVYAAVLLALAAGFVTAPSVALLLAPAAALLLLLAHGIFPGEQLIERLRAHRARHRPRRRLLPVARPVAPATIRRTGRHIAFALAVRPPPARFALTR